MAKTAEYTLNAVKKYNEKFDRKAVNLPKGTAERIKQLTGKSCNAYIVDLVLTDLDRLERKENNSAPNAENAPNQPYTKPSNTNNSRPDWEREEQERLDKIGRENLQEQLVWLKQQYPEYYKDAKLPTAPPDQEVPF